MRHWRLKTTKRSADYLILHGANEEEINRWKGHDGTARQQRAMRRMYWLLEQPFMAQFAEFLRERATQNRPYKFAELSFAVKGILVEAMDNTMEASTENVIPRKKEELAETIIWLQRAINVCTNVFYKDIDDGVY